MLRAWGRYRQKVSVIGAVSISPVARQLGLYSATDAEGHFNGQRAVAFLRELPKHLRGKVVVVWYGNINHRSTAVREFLRRNRRLWLERLPAYAPELNPVEAVWGWLKYAKLANFVPTDVGNLDDGVSEYLIPLKCDPHLLRRLWDGSDLPFPTPHPRLPADQ